MREFFKALWNNFFVKVYVVDVYLDSGAVYTTYVTKLTFTRGREINTYNIQRWPGMFFGLNRPVHHGVDNIVAINQRANVWRWLTLFHGPK